jgi:pyruvyltransferase
MNTYSLFSWKPDPLTADSNFGDELFPLICERITGSRIMKAAPNGSTKLLAGGSIIQFALDGDVVWGAGVRSPDQAFHFNNIDVRAVRGPLSRDFLVNVMKVECPEIYGDPALLLPLLFPELKRTSVANDDGKEGKVVGIVPHLSDIPFFQDGIVPNAAVKSGHDADAGTLLGKIKTILPTLPPLEVVKEILSCDFVIASSLHGIIVAEAFGIPSRWLRLSESEPEFKFHDYFLGTGRTSKWARNVREALEMGPEQPIASFDAQKLLDAFPGDLSFNIDNHKGTMLKNHE